MLLMENMLLLTFERQQKRKFNVPTLRVLLSSGKKTSDEPQTFLINKNKLFKLIYCLIPFILKLNKNHSIGWQVMST